MVFQPASEYEKALASASGLSRALKKPVAERSLWDALTQPQPRTLLHALTGLPDQWDRATLLPMETNRQTGERRMAAPQAAMDLLSALMLPGDVAQGKVNMGQPGQFSPEAMQAATNAAVNLGITGGALPKPSNALGTFGGDSRFADIWGDFPEWFKGSQVINAKNEPKILYHGSPRQLDEILPDMNEPGAWFASSPSIAQHYARGDDGGVYEAIVSAKNPMVVDFSPFWDEKKILINGVPHSSDEFSGNLDFVRRAKSQGHDSVNFPYGNFTEDSDTWVAFLANQIRMLQE
jgi:hypothetical protein